MTVADPIDAALAFAERCQTLDRTLRREGRFASPFEKDALAGSFWSIAHALDAPPEEGWPDDLGSRLLAVIGPWMWRSLLWNRAYFKPHGYTGDYRMLEGMYDLENNPCEEPYQKDMKNCVFYTLGTLPCVKGLWHRRRFYRDLLRTELDKRGSLKVLDVACGGARYTRDFLTGVEDTSGISITLVDQDASALAYCRNHALAAWGDQIQTYSLPIHKLPQYLSDGDYDLVLSTGLYDYLTDEVAQALSAHLAGLLRPGGVLAVSNYTHTDPSDTVRRWVTDWHLVRRDCDALASVLPPTLDVITTYSPEGTLAYAVGRTS